MKQKIEFFRILKAETICAVWFEKCWSGTKIGGVTYDLPGSIAATRGVCRIPSIIIAGSGRDTKAHTGDVLGVRHSENRSQCDYFKKVQHFTKLFCLSTLIYPQVLGRGN